MYVPLSKLSWDFKYMNYTVTVCRIPSWTLQRLVPVVKIGQFDMCKCQIRAYVILVNGEIFLYPVYEVRLPYWSIPLDDILASETASSSLSSSSSGKGPEWSDSVERLCVGSGRARPYNEGRDKKRTRRMLLSEIDELRQAGAGQAVRSCVQGFFAGITALIAERRKRKEECLRDFSSAESAVMGALGKDGSVIGPRIVGRSVAVLGVDLVISEKSSIGNSSSSNVGGSSSNNNSSSDSSGGGGSSSGSDGNGLDAYIVEVNNNPAMPSPTKHSMSEQYRQHLVDLAAAIIGLGLSHCSTIISILLISVI